MKKVQNKKRNSAENVEYYNRENFSGQGGKST